MGSHICRLFVVKVSVGINRDGGAGGAGGALAPPLSFEEDDILFCFCFSICLFHALSRLIISRSISRRML